MLLPFKERRLDQRNPIQTHLVVTKLWFRTHKTRTIFPSLLQPSLVEMYVYLITVSNGWFALSMRSCSSGGYFWSKIYQKGCAIFFSSNAAPNRWDLIKAYWNHVVETLYWILEEWLWENIIIGVNYTTFPWGFDSGGFVNLRI